jgi:transposase
METWLRSHPGVEIVCRDGSGAYGEAIRRALPDAVQVSDRWHLWANLCDKTLAEVRSDRYLGLSSEIAGQPLEGLSGTSGK